MKISITPLFTIFRRVFSKISAQSWQLLVIVPAIILSICATTWAYTSDVIVAYGDAESHLNIAKRVIHSLTPGMAQLGGIWLPLPHIAMLPFVHNDFLWRTGLAGSFVSGIAFIFASIFIYRSLFLLTKSKLPSLFGTYIFMLNPNILYMQSTPMTELLLICFFVISSYYFIRFLYDLDDVHSLIISAFFGFLAVLTRYDGWFLVLFEAVSIVILFFSKKISFKKAQGLVILFSTLAFFGIGLWFLWDLLILGDPLYFTHSEFSARAQQLVWKQKGMLPSYHSLPASFGYYTVNVMSTSGMLIFFVAVIALIVFLHKKIKTHSIVLFILFVPYIFNVFTLFMGQSVIFIPHLTPISFEWRLFNVRYGVMLMPAVAILLGYLFSKSTSKQKIAIIFICLIQFGLFVSKYSPVITYVDGVEGLSQAKRPDAEKWLHDNYDGGLVLMDDYARITSVLRSGIKMQNIIYIGNKPYWEESLEQPEKYADWIVMQKEDTLWRTIYTNPGLQGRLYSHFQKVYTSPDILIFRKVKK